MIRIKFRVNSSAKRSELFDVHFEFVLSAGGANSKDYNIIVVWHFVIIIHYNII